MATRNTNQQRVIKEQLRTLANHPTAEQVYAAVHESNPTIGKATVYRVLSRMADEGGALRVKINNGPDCFDHKTHAHYHVRCTKCGRVDDVEIPVEAGIDADAQQASGYMISGHTLQFDGVCPQCQGATNKAFTAQAV